MANIELDGVNKKIKVDSGDLTLDVPGDIVLDADGGDVVVADGGTNILKVTNSSSDVVLQSGDVLKGIAGTANSIDVWCSVVDQIST